MFYSESLLSKQGPLARVWLAANLERKLSKNQFLQTNIEQSVEAIVSTDTAPMALRLSGQLLLGVVRIYSRKARYLLEDCTEALHRIKTAFRPANVDLPTGGATANVQSLTLQDTITAFDLTLDPLGLGGPGFGLSTQLGIGPDVSFPTPQKKIATYNVMDPSEITLPDLDRSIELGRGLRMQDEEDDLVGAEDDLELDIGDNEEALGLDDSIEIGRGGIDDENISLGLGGEEEGADRLSMLSEPINGLASSSPHQRDSDEGPLTPIDDNNVLDNVSIIGQEDNNPFIGLEEGERPAGEENGLVLNEESEKRRQQQPKRKRGQLLRIDESTELDSSVIKHQQEDRSDITKQHDQFSDRSNICAFQLLMSTDAQSLAQKFIGVALPGASSQQISRAQQGQAQQRAKRRRISDEMQEEPMVQDEFDLPMVEDQELNIELPPMEEQEELAGPQETEEGLENISSSSSSCQPIHKVAVSSLEAAQKFREQLKESESLTIQQATENANRSTAVQTFFDVLLLATKNAIKVDQIENYGEITVTAKPELYSTQWDLSAATTIDV